MNKFAKLVELQERQVLFIKAERDEDDEDQEAPWLLSIVFYLLDGTTKSEMNLGFDTEEARNEAFDKLVDDDEFATARARNAVDSIKWMEETLTTEDENDD